MFYDIHHTWVIQQSCEFGLYLNYILVDPKETHIYNILLNIDRCKTRAFIFVALLT